jgi:hypothetical protein
MREFKDMPLDIQEYYGGYKKNHEKNHEYIDVSGHCYVRLVSRTKVNKMITDDKKYRKDREAKSYSIDRRGILDIKDRKARSY